jgi:hypothetical protein
MAGLLSQGHAAGDRSQASAGSRCWRCCQQMDPWTPSVKSLLPGICRRDPSTRPLHGKLCRQGCQGIWPSLGPTLAETSKVPAPYIKSSAAAKSHALPTVGKARTITSEDEGPGKNDEGLHSVCVHQCRQPSCNKPQSTKDSTVAGPWHPWFLRPRKGPILENRVYKNEVGLVHWGTGRQSCV